MVISVASDAVFDEHKCGIVSCTVEVLVTTDGGMAQDGRCIVIPFGCHAVCDVVLGSGLQLVEGFNVVEGIALQTTTDRTAWSPSETTNEWCISVSAVGRNLKRITPMHSNSNESIRVSLFHELHAYHASWTKTAPEARILFTDDATGKTLIGYGERT